MQQDSFEEATKAASLKLKWTLGLNYKIFDGVHNLTSPHSKQLFYAVGNTGVIFDYQNNTQRLLQGHCNTITCTAYNRQKGILITADSGEDSMLVIWDVVTGVPKKTIFDPHPNGILDLDISTDGSMIVTLSKAEEPSNQYITLWKWQEYEPSYISTRLDPKIFCLQRFIKLNDGQNEFATTGESLVVFWEWETASKGFNFYAPSLDKIKRTLTQTVFIPNSTQAVTGTKDGIIIVFDISLIMEDYTQPEERRPIKQVNLMNNNNKIDAMKKNIVQPSINVLKIEGKFLVVGSSNGCVRFYDDQYRIEAWFEDIGIGSIYTISFSSEITSSKNPDDDDSGGAGNKDDQLFVCPDFIVVDDKAKVTLLKAELFEKIDKEEKSGEVLMESIIAPIVSTSVRPYSSTLTISCENSVVYSWDFEKKNPRIITLKEFQQDEVPSCLQYSPSGKFLSIGTKIGTVYFYEADTGDWAPPLFIAEVERYKPTVQMLTFAPDSRHLAVMDQYFGVTLFVFGEKNWTFGGKIRIHHAPIKSIAFGQSMGESIDERSEVRLRLFSISEDMTLAEYEIQTKKQEINESNKYSRLKLKSIFPIEQECFPTACIWYPINPFKENILLTINQQYKIKLWSMLRDSMKICKKTCLGPTYGGEITKLLTLNHDNGSDKQEKYLAYSTKQKVIGIIKLPLDSNPNNSIGLIAHAGKITSINTTIDSKLFFTSGSTDFCVNIWTIDYNSLRENFLPKTKEDPFPELLEGGITGQTMSDLKDFFYYSQIRSKDEHTTKARKLDGKVPLEAIANMMRSMGFYPTQKEIENMQNEIKFSSYGDNSRETLSELNLAMFLRLFVNHRPVFGISKSEIQGALAIILETEKGVGGAEKEKEKAGGGTEKSVQNFLARDRFVNILRTEGEKLTEEEVRECQKILLGEGAVFPEEIDAHALCHKILGFEDPDEERAQEEEDDEVEYGGLDKE